MIKKDDDLKEIIKKLNLKEHPEGGWYCETYRSDSNHSGNGSFPDSRSYCTAIYFLITSTGFSALHRIKSDEIWHFYSGDPVEIIEITPAGELTITNLGNAGVEESCFQHVVKAGIWFGSRIKEGGSWALTGCTVAPGFSFEDFELASRDYLTELYPAHSELINQMTRL